MRLIEFIDTLERLWRVTERDTRRDPGARGDTCLIFSTGDTVRRVWNYPLGWSELPSHQLERLGEDVYPVRRRAS